MNNSGPAYLPRRRRVETNCARGEWTPSPRRWSLSEFLNLLEFRSQCWCVVTLDCASGFNIPHSDAAFFYAVLAGKALLDSSTHGSVELGRGDIAMIVSGDAHAVRSQARNPAGVLEFLCQNNYVDTPPAFAIGSGEAVTRVLCGRLRVRWPGGQHPEGLPAILHTDAAGSVINLERLERCIAEKGGSALLTRTASLFFTAAFQRHPECEQIFQASARHDPIARARHFMETHPFQHWTVQILANKVGMGRSSFAVHFLQEVGRTPMEYLTSLRMEHAARLLAQSDIKIAAIGELVGYRSEAAFSRRFTHHFGVSPGRMRKQGR